MITGITGQDGTYLSRFLLDKGYRVYGLVRYNAAPNISNLDYLGIEDRVKLLNVDLTELSDVIRVVEKIQPDEIYNLAAQSSVGLSFEQPIATYEFNTSSTLNLLESVRIVNPGIKFYQASSSEMYGNIDKDKLPVTEKHYLNPSSPYGVSKASAHMITTSYRQCYNLFASCGILFNHESCLRPSKFVTKKIVETALKISDGSVNELVMGNMNISRDWGYAPEYIKVIWMILQNGIPDDFIVCSGEVCSLEEFVCEVFTQLDLDYKDFIKVDNNLYRPLDLDIIYGDNSKARNTLNWNYNFKLPELVRKLIEDEIEYSEWKNRHFHN